MMDLKRIKHVRGATGIKIIKEAAKAAISKVQFCLVCEEGAVSIYFGMASVLLEIDGEICF